MRRFLHRLQTFLLLGIVPGVAEGIFGGRDLRTTASLLVCGVVAGIAAAALAGIRAPRLVQGILTGAGAGFAVGICRYLSPSINQLSFVEAIGHSVGTGIFLATLMRFTAKDNIFAAPDGSVIPAESPESQSWVTSFRTAVVVPLIFAAVALAVAATRLPDRQTPTGAWPPAQYKRVVGYRFNPPARSETFSMLRDGVLQKG